MWAIYGNPEYTKLLDMSIESSLKNANDVQRVILCDNNLSYDNSECQIFHANFVGGPSAKMSIRYEFAAYLLNEYDYVMHIDTDTLVTSDLTKVLVDKPAGLSLASEYSDHPQHFSANRTVQMSAADECWAKPLLKNEEETNYFKTIPSLCMGVWLADKRDVSALMKVRQEVLDFELGRNHGICYDQHAAVYRLVKDNCWNLHLQPHVTHCGGTINTDDDMKELFKSSVSVVHFAGGVAPHESKKRRMKDVLDYMEKNYDKR